MATERMSILPMIKCSTCGTDIEISKLADHVCVPAQPKNTDTVPLKLDRAATFGGPPFSSKSIGQPRNNRMPPPARINPSAANQPFRPRDQLSPVGHQYGSLRSPLSPGRGRPPYKMSRSATSPMPRSPRPPSPDLPSNMDCAFPPFPTSKPASKRAKSKPRERLDPHQHRYAEGSPHYAPLSPRLNAGENITKRMDTIAPGPFDGRGDRRPSTSDGRSGDYRPSTSDGREASGSTRENNSLQRTTTQNSVSSNLTTANQRSSLSSNRSRGSTFSGHSIGLPAHPKQTAGGIPPMPPPPSQKMERQTEGIDAFLNRLQKETSQPLKSGTELRSNTYPVHQEGKDYIQKPERPRRPSEPGTLTRPTGEQLGHPIHPSEDMPRARTVSPHLDHPAPPQRIAAYEKDMALHTPSDSGLSDGSFSSDGLRSTASSRSSPAASMDSGQHSRKVSKIAEGPIPRVTSPESFMDPRTPPRPQRSPPRAERYPGAFTYNGATTSKSMHQTSYIAYSSDVPESPLDPAIQLGIFSQKFPVELHNAAQTEPSPNTERSTEPPSPECQTLPPPVRPGTAKKGNCRGCSEPIIGKSVKDSSGRLTGRYHKQCFVCQTCRSPFPTAEFYVFDNSPYCEHHYHELNGSLCRSCNRGIEGQYLETDQRWKFHPKCFTCLTCRVVLRDDYYEVDGKAYCDRHAYAAQKSNVSLAPGNLRPQTNNVQKRRTRLMMMM